MLFSLLFFAVNVAAQSWIWPSCGFDTSFKHRFVEYLDTFVKGQPVARNLILPIIQAHLDNIQTLGESSRAVSMSLYGATGTGKSYVSTFVEKALFAGKPNSHVFYGSHYLDPAKVQDYRREIANTIQTKLMSCSYALFIFVDTHMMTNGTLDSLTGFLDFNSQDLNGVDYSKAIFIFQSNDCAQKINWVLTEHTATGLAREDLDARVLEEGLRQCLQASNFGDSMLYNSGLVTNIPFLPLTRVEVEQCANSLLKIEREKGKANHKWKELQWTQQVEHWLAQKLKFVDQYSMYGCKGLDVRIAQATFEIDQVNTMSRRCESSELSPWDRFTGAKKMCYRYARQSLTLSIVDDRVCVRENNQGACL